MLKKTKQKHKKKFFNVLVPMVLIFACLSLAFYVLFPYLSVNLANNTLPALFPPSHSAQPFFYGENIDMSRILPTSQHYVVNGKGEDLIDIAANLGINLVRITNGQRSFDTNADSIYTEEQWNQVLIKMQRKGVKALIVIEVASNNKDYYFPDIRQAYLHLVQQYIDSGVFANPNVYAVDIKNEPLLTDDNLNMLHAAHAMLKAKYPNLRQTVGWWATPKEPKDPYKPNNYDWSNYSAGRVLDNIVDFYSIHMYGLGVSGGVIGLNPNLRTKLFISQVQNGLQTNKPILIEEFGEANGDAVSDQDTIGSPELLANVYQGVYQALEEMQSSQIFGAVAFQFYSRTSGPDAWAIVKKQGDYLFPAAYILQGYALGKKNPSLQAATVVFSQSYVVRNADNNTVRELHISDRIGFALHLKKGLHYSISVSTNGLLQPAEVFHYRFVHNDYVALYQAIQKGSVNIKVMVHTPCVQQGECIQTVFTLNVIIQ